jgi:hypothetical protein
MLNAKFDKGQVPTVALINHATVDLGFDIHKLANVLWRQVRWHVGPVWGVGCNMTVEKDFKPNQWAIVFLDDADVSGALGYHDLTPTGMPVSKCFVKTVKNAGADLTVTASHELLEMLLDPAINLIASHSSGDFYAYELCDPCEEEKYLIDGMPVSDFVYPSWFEEFHQPNSTQFDYMNKISHPFQILTGGYMPIYKNGSWTQIFGSRDKAMRFAEEDRRQHRSEYRKI